MQRRVIEVSGIVQGVGLRPYVHSLASQLCLSGFVRNKSGSVVIEVEGAEAVLDLFLDRIRCKAPPLARIHRLSWQPIAVKGDKQFCIVASDASASADVFVSPDVATCQNCRNELFDPADRRYRYPFLNCTNCGPRLTIIRRAPYDRANTTMSGFQMCARCAAEYVDTNDRRFHAQPIACPACGPHLQLLDAKGEPQRGVEPLDTFVDAIRKGKIGAIKGLGGYHLTCMARDKNAVRILRQRKHRDEKPFAVMVADVRAAKIWCCVNDVESELLSSPARPIVLLQKRQAGDEDSELQLVAPGNPCIGIMLPSTPLHELLLDLIGDEPLVMTSGNRSDEPMAHDDRDAVERLRGIADVFLVHNRPIHVRCDDSVVRVIDRRESPVRRSRGYAPLPIELPFDVGQPMLAVGGQLKGAFGLAIGSNALLSHHLGDLDHLEAYQAFQRDVDLYQQLFEIAPRLIVHDTHPDYASTGYALNRGRLESIPCAAVQHHHAHLASCMAEHRLSGDVMGVILDGSGYGADGTIWGGEFLVGGYARYQRAAHLRPVRLPGGDQATKEPWRVALSYLDDAACDVEEVVPKSKSRSIPVLRQMISRGLNAPRTSSAGRLFDAVAAIAGLRQTVSFEGQSAIELEVLAMQSDCGRSYPFAVGRAAGNPEQGPLEIDTRPLIRDVVSDRRRAEKPAVIARRFHNTLSDIIVETCQRIRSQTQLNRVVLSGGVFMNAILGTQVAAELTSQHFSVYRHEQVPTNDGGLCLGQLAIAAARPAMLNSVLRDPALNA